MLPRFPLPYYAVIFTSLRANADPDYGMTNDQLEKMAEDIEGFLGTESARNTSDGLGVSISYWQTKEAIEEWRQHTHHKMAKEKGIKDWYSAYSIRICSVESDGFFAKN